MQPFCKRGHAIAISGRNKAGACILCQRDYQRAYQKEWNKTEKGQWFKTHRDRTSTRKYELKQRYGITPAIYQDMFEKQKGCCAICGKHQLEFKRKLCVDHNHETGTIRGLLCSGCNYSLGFFENKMFRAKAEIYLGGYANSITAI